MLLLFTALKKSQVIFEDGLGCDLVTMFSHVFFDVIHEVFNAVFVF